jgi:hypothetical protein
MASYRVDRTAKESTYTGGEHRHIAALCLADGRRVPKATAIYNIEHSVESYYTFAGGERAEVEVVARCSSCLQPYLRTDKDTTTKNNLLSLPDCA